MKKNTLLFFLLFLSFQTSCMIMLQSLPSDAITVVMKNLDYKSNIRFIMMCEKFYDFYAKKNSILFTDHYLHAHDYMNAMIQFARNDDVERVKLLIEHEGGANKNDRENILGHFSVAGQNSQISQTINVYGKRYGKKDVLNVWRIFTCRPLLTLVLKQGYQNFNCCANENGRTPLHNAVVSGDIKYCRFLLLLYDLVDPNIQDKGGDTPLHMAVPQRNEIAKCLFVDSRVDPNIQNESGYTPLHHVVVLHPIINGDKNIEALKLLLADPRINPNIRDKSGFTPLYLAAMCLSRENIDKRIEILNCLLADPRVDPNIKDNNGDTPLYSSVLLNGSKILKCLLAHPQVDCNSKNNEGKTVYDYAYDPEIIELLAPCMSFINTYKKPVLEFICRPTVIGLLVAVGVFGLKNFKS
jgi:ankyrin repeat protein